MARTCTHTEKKKETNFKGKHKRNKEKVQRFQEVGCSKKYNRSEIQSNNCIPSVLGDIIAIGNEIRGGVKRHACCVQKY